MPQLPAIQYKVEITPFGVNSPVFNSIQIYRWVGVCPCCGGNQWTLTAVWDFDFDRCMDFHLRCGEYMNETDLNRGMELWEFEKDGGVLS